MTDWTTCRVVRDRDGDLWGRNTAWTEPSYRRWVKLGGYWEEDGCFQIHMECRHGPLTPVLDADGLPVVRTMGDLTARHIGRRVRWDDDEEEGVLDFLGAERCRFECLADLDGRENPRTYGAWLPLDTPCEVLP